MIVLDGIQFKLFVKMFCHDKFLLQYDTFIVSLIDGMKSSHFDLYYLYSNTKNTPYILLSFQKEYTFITIMSIITINMTFHAYLTRFKNILLLRSFS